MTTIKLNNGKPVLRDGKVGASQGCCCNGECLCCSCVQRVRYMPSSPEADAKPFAGIAPASPWPVDDDGYRYAEFPCHYVEYAFSQYAAQIFPNAPNAGADASYPYSGQWERVLISSLYAASSYGETRCTGSTQGECQPCLAYPSGPFGEPATPPTDDPLPTLAQLQQRCGIYHPCVPCEKCSEIDGCGVAGTNLGQVNGETYPNGIPWPPPEGTCPCRACDILCLEEVRGIHWAKPRTQVVNGVRVYDNGPATLPPPILHDAQPGDVAFVRGVLASLAYSWRCNASADMEDSASPIYPEVTLPCDGSFSSGWEPPEGDWWEVEYPFRTSYWRVRVVTDCCDCQSYAISPPYGWCWPEDDESVQALACGGLSQLSQMGIYGLTTLQCAIPTACQTPCWDVPESVISAQCNPFP